MGSHEKDHRCIFSEVRDMAKELIEQLHACDTLLGSFDPSEAQNGMASIASSLKLMFGRAKLLPADVVLVQARLKESILPEEPVDRKQHQLQTVRLE